MKRQTIILSVCGAVVLLLCGGVGYFLFSAWHEKNTVADDRNQQMDQLRRIYDAKVFPSPENIEQYGKDAETVGVWRGVASNLFAKGGITVDASLSPSSFKEQLVQDIRVLNGRFRTPTLKGAKEGTQTFGFDFDRYLGGDLPTAQDVPRLSLQLSMIKRLCDALHDAGVMELVALTREKFDTGRPAEEAAPQESTQRRRRNRGSGESAPTASAASSGSAKTEGAYAGKEQFEFTFMARPNVLIAALNKLASIDLFTVVSATEIHKKGDMLKAFTQKRIFEQNKKDSAEDAGGEGEEKAKTPGENKLPTRELVTDPELEPPVTVKLVIDVYTF